MNFFDQAENDVSKSLLTFLETIILKNKHSENLEKWKLKILTIAHAIVSAIKRSFLSSIQIGLSSLLLKKFESKELLNLLSALGISASYKEATLLTFQLSHIHLKNTCQAVLPNLFSITFA